MHYRYSFDLSLASLAPTAFLDVISLTTSDSGTQKSAGMMGKSSVSGKCVSPN